MGIILPAALGLLALAIPIIILYMLRQRRQERAVSSSMLWQRALLDRTVNAPWRRPPRNLLLLLQLLLLALLVFSLARPFLLTDTPITGNSVVVLDASASMQATDGAGGAGGPGGPGGESRFERARQEAETLIEGMAGEQKMTLILAGPVAQLAVAASGSKTTLRDALKALTPSNGRSDVVAALTLAAGQARQLGDATTVLISDGALPPNVALPTVPGKARYINVGASARNMGITQMSLRDTPDGPQLFASVYNSGPEPSSAILSINADGALRDSRRVELAGGDEASITLGDLPLDTRLVEATLKVDGVGADGLAADNLAWAVRPPRGGANVLLVSEGNSFLEKALSLQPNVKLFRATPATYAPSEGFGLTVLDAYLPAQLPPGNLLIFAPPQSLQSALVPVSGTLLFPTIGAVAANDPLMRFVDLSGTHLASAQRIITPPWARPIVRTAEGDPLVIVGETDGRRVAVVAFDLHQSDLPLQIAFPILTANLVEWLQPRNAVSAPPNLGAGDAISIRPAPEADEIRVTLPGEEGQVTTLQPAEGLSFGRTDALGVYSVQQVAKGQPLGEPERFAVNLFNRDESNITPQPDLAFAGTELVAGSSAAQRPLEIWPWVLLASLGLLAAEWWLYNSPRSLRRRRATVKRST